MVFPALNSTSRPTTRCCRLCSSGKSTTTVVLIQEAVCLESESPVSLQSYPPRQSRSLTRPTGLETTQCHAAQPRRIHAQSPSGFCPFPSSNPRAQEPLNLPENRPQRDEKHLSPADGLNPTHLVGLGCHLAPLTLQSMATTIPPEPLPPGRDEALVALGGLFGKGTRQPRALRDIATTRHNQNSPSRHGCVSWPAPADAVSCYPARGKQWTKTQGCGTRRSQSALNLSPSCPGWRKRHVSIPSGARAESLMVSRCHLSIDLGHQHSTCMRLVVVTPPLGGRSP